MTPLNGVTSDDFVLAERVSGPTAGRQDNNDDRTSEEDDESDADEFLRHFRLATVAGATRMTSSS